MNECPRFSCTNYCRAPRPHAYTVSPTRCKSGYFSTFLQALNSNHVLSFNKSDGWNLWFYYCFPNYPELCSMYLQFFSPLVGCLFISRAYFFLLSRFDPLLFRLYLSSPRLSFVFWPFMWVIQSVFLPINATHSY